LSRSVSILIPVKDGGEDLAACFAGISRQRGVADPEVVVVDSGSSDGSVDLARDFGAQVIEIAAPEFDHGRTRNLAAEKASGEVLVFISQDAEPLGTSWLETLVSRLDSDAGIAGVYGRQLARHDAVPPESYFLDYLYGSTPRVQALDGAAGLSMDTTLFSNANGAMRRDVWEQFPFAEDMIMSEDQEWARRVLLAGWRLAYEPAAAVRHSHSYTLGTAFRRFFDSGVSADRSYLPAPGAAAALRGNALRYASGELRWLGRSGNRRWIPYTCVYELTKFAGLQLGRRHRLLGARLSRRLSARPEWWGAG
jgi:rhamnosyltransferase